MCAKKKETSPAPESSETAQADETLPFDTEASMLTVHKNGGRFMINVVTPEGKRHLYVGDIDDDKPLRVLIEQ